MVLVHDGRFGDPIESSACRMVMARRLVGFLEGSSYPYAKLLGVYGSDTRETVVLEVNVQRPQRPLAPIARRETIAVRFLNDLAPLAYALRPDFPSDAVHLNVGFEEEPSSLCLDDRPWIEVRQRWTPFSYIERIRWWLSATARGDLHGEGQGPEPIFATGQSVILPEAFFSGDWDDKRPLHIHAVNTDTEPQTIVMREGSRDNAPGGGFLPMILRAEPQVMQRLRIAPRSIEALDELLQPWGIDLIGALRERAVSLLSDRRQISHRPLLLLWVPLLNSDGRPTGGAEVKALTTSTDFDFANLGVELGVFVYGPPPLASQIVLRVPKAPEMRGKNIPAVMLSVHTHFTREAAALASGLPMDARRVTMVGAGAIGSHLMEIMRRDGFGSWTIIDNDALLPHNIQRHRAGDAHVGLAKAKIMAAHADWVVGAENESTGLAVNVMSERPELDAAFKQVELIIDASASVPVSRYLSDLKATTVPRLSVFFNPAGHDVVLLGEDEARNVTLSALEAQYYRAVLEIPALQNHLAGGTHGYRYAASCRSVSFTMPEHQVSMLSGAVAGEIRRYLANDSPALVVCAGGSEGGLERISIPVLPVTHKCVGDWDIIIDDGIVQAAQALRSKALPAETGGIILGTIDIPRRQICVVKLADAPIDSFGDQDGFERGTRGLTAVLEDVATKTAGQVEYVGEWHSHPEGVEPQVSTTDLGQLVWLGEERRMEGLPAVMLIVGDHDWSLNIVIPDSTY